VLTNDLATSKSATSWAYDAGTRHLEINSECAWTVEVIADSAGELDGEAALRRFQSAARKARTRSTYADLS
jgi:hypothetical protein